MIVTPHRQTFWTNAPNSTWIRWLRAGRTCNCETSLFLIDPCLQHIEQACFIHEMLQKYDFGWWTVTFKLCTDPWLLSGRRQFGYSTGSFKVFTSVWADVWGQRGPKRHQTPSRLLVSEKNPFFPPLHHLKHAEWGFLLKHIYFLASHRLVSLCLSPTTKPAARSCL